MEWFCACMFRAWEEGDLKPIMLYTRLYIIPYLYVIAAVSWRNDGAKIIAVRYRNVLTLASGT